MSLIGPSRAPWRTNIPGLTKIAPGPPRWKYHDSNLRRDGKVPPKSKASEFTKRWVINLHPVFHR